MSVWETITADPFVWTVAALLAVVLLAGIWRGTEWLLAEMVRLTQRRVRRRFPPAEAEAVAAALERLRRVLRQR